MPIACNVFLPTTEITAYHRRWAENRAFVDGEEAVKAQRRFFLPAANPEDTDDEYQVFLDRTRVLPSAVKIAQSLGLMFFLQLVGAARAGRDGPRSSPPPPPPIAPPPRAGS